MSYKRAKERNRRLRKLYNATKNSYGAGAWYDNDKGRYIRYSVHDKDLKTRCRRATRRRLKRMTDATLKGGAYKKAFDYWWILL